MLKVDSDPAQVIVNHASFRVKLATPSRPAPRRVAAPGGLPVGAGGAETARIPAMGGADSARGAAARGARRRAPVVWSGKSQPGDPGASGLLQAVRNSGATSATSVSSATSAVAAASAGPYERGSYDAGATQVIPRVEVDDRTQATPVVGGGSDGPLLPPMRQAVGAYDQPRTTRYGGGQDDGDDTTHFIDRARYGDRPGYEDGAGDADHAGYDADHSGYGDDYAGYGDEDDELTETGSRARVRTGASRGATAVRHAYFPGRRMNLGVVLLPLRVFLGLISIYAGMGKLCDPVYFDGGERGSMVKWLNSLHPWALAEPLRDFALSHPVGAGLSIAFLQIVAGVLTALGLWQRVAASLGALLSAALLVTVSWKTVPAYDAPDIIYLAAWSPLIIAGAPVYSVDGKLAGDAWRRLGPRSSLLDLRRYVLRRGTIVAGLVIGTTMLVGSVLGGAVRSSGVVTVPGPNHAPVNQLPGEPLPQDSTSHGSASGSPSADAHGKGGKPSGTPSARHSHSPSSGTHGSSHTPGAAGTGGSGAGATQGSSPTQTQSAGGAQAPSRTQRQQAPSGTGHQGAAPSTSGSTASGGSSSSSGGPTSSGSGAGGDSSGGSSGGSSSGGGPLGGLLG
nr:DoxX family protein [Streptomyces montanisoli]